MAERLSAWAASELGMSACHPAGKDVNGESNKNLWPPPEGTMPAPSEENNPLTKLLMDVSTSQASLLEDYLYMTNRVSLHRCSDYCLRQERYNLAQRKCRMEFGTEQTPGKPL